MKQNLRGVMPGLLAPFNQRQQVDTDSLRRLVRFNIEQGIDGLYVGGSTGEAFLPSSQEREQVLEIVAEGRLALVNPPAAMLAQSKATQALIWSLYEDGSFFSPEERAAIAAHMLPTYFENRFLGRCPYVTKPVYGREGGAVTIYGSDGVAWTRDDECNYWEQPLVYQQYVALPKQTVRTLNGLYCGRIIYGTFLVGGRGSALVARVGSRITGNMAYYQPLCLSTDASKGE